MGTNQPWEQIKEKRQRRRRRSTNSGYDLHKRYHGKGYGFELSSGRDPALVNKACDFLKDDYVVPPNWRQDENKGMVIGEDGRWIQPERPKLDDHPNDMYLHLRELGLETN